MTTLDAAHFEAAARRETGKSAALAAYVLHVLALPSWGLTALPALAIAYASRAQTEPWVRAHYERQIKDFWIAVFWGIGLLLLSMPVWAVTLLITDLPIGYAMATGALVMLAWLAMRGLSGAARLARNAPARDPDEAEAV